MLKTALKHLISAGIDESSLINISPIRITNITTFLLICSLVAHLPVAIVFWQIQGDIFLVLLLIHIVILSWVPALNHFKRHRAASTMLAITFYSYIVAASLLWPDNLRTHYFLLLGTFVAPFIFARENMKHMWLIVSAFCLSFVSIEYYFISLTPSLSSHVFSAQLTNACFFALSIALTGVHICRNNYRGWQKISSKHQQASGLINNMLPENIATDLALKQSHEPTQYEQASVLFVDITNFTQYCHCHSPNEVIDTLNDVFSAIDDICEVHRLEKIKTIGDEYMAVAGVPLVSTKHAIQACSAAIDIQAWFTQYAEQNGLTNKLRIGIGSGEIIAGVIGKHKYCFDVWGNAVNLASRMQSLGKCDRIQVSACTYELAKCHFQFSAPHTLDVTGLGQQTSYWLKAKN